MHNTKGLKGITRHRLYELQYFCLQYRQWCHDLRGRLPDDRRTEYETKRQIVEETVEEAGGDIAPWLMEAVTHKDVTFTTLQARGMPCCKDYFYERRRLFYTLLDARKK